MATVTYQFNAWNSGNPGSWDTNGVRIVDGNDGTYGRDNDNADYAILTGNACPGSGLGTISKVEVAVLWASNSTDCHPNLVPYFGGSTAGDSHEITTYPGATRAWSAWQDITGDTNAPDPWEWADVVALDLRVIMVRTTTGRVDAYAVAIQVTYEPVAVTADDAITLYSGPTITAAELSPYGGTLDDTGAAQEGGGGDESKSGTDTGELTEAGTGTALTSDTDTGTLAETGSGTAAATGVDAGTLAEASALALAHADTGALAEAGTGSAALADTETGTATEGQPAIAVTGVDAGTGSESVAIATATTDTGTSDDTGLVTAAASGVDTGTAAETGLGAADTADSDSAELTDDGVATQSGTDATDTDAGTLAEAGSSSATTADVEVGTLAELPALAVVASDTGTGTEQPALALTSTDTGTLAEDGAKTTGGVPDTPITASDTATLTDTGEQFGSAPTADGTDTGTLTESGAVVAVAVAVPRARSNVMPPMIVVPDYVEHPRLYFNGNDSDVIGLGEFAYVRKTTVAPSYAPPDPYGWLADTGDEEFAAVALLIG